jgi:hypothetical protein
VISQVRGRPIAPDSQSAVGAVISGQPFAAHQGLRAGGSHDGRPPGRGRYLAQDHEPTLGHGPAPRSQQEGAGRAGENRSKRGKADPGLLIDVDDLVEHD